MTSHPGDAVTAGYTDWKRWSDAGFGRFSRSEARYFGWLLRRCGAAQPARVLEIGYGNGAFLGFVRQRGAEVVGIEVQPALRERARAAGLPACERLDELPAEPRFDLIAAFDVLEHIEQAALPGFMAELSRRLAPQGLLLLRVPNGESPFGRINQHGDLTHVSTLGLSKFHQLAALCGLAVSWHGDVPVRVVARAPKAWLRALVRWCVERTVAFAYRWDARTLGPNLVVALRPVRPASGG